MYLAGNTSRVKKYLLFESSEQSLKYLAEGEKIKVSAGGMAVCVVRSIGGLIAFANACPHRGHPLHEGHLNHLGEIVCASHAYRFRLSTGEESEQRCTGLKRIDVIEESGQFFLVF